jgi:folate-binding protein YgfZ
MDLASMTRGYRALREGAALVDLGARGKIRVTGEDRVRLLHAMTTNHIAQLQPGQGCYAFFLNAQGRILADANILCLAGHFLLDTEPETRERICAHLDKYIIADDVTLEDVTAELATVAVEGPQAGRLLASLGAPLPEGSHETAPWGDWLVARLTASGAEGYWVLAPASDKGKVLARLLEAGAVEAEADDVHVVRLEHGRPRYGEDLSERFLANEAQVLRAMHFNKGCYLGQEIVERVRSRGQVHRLLVPLRIETTRPPEPGAALTAEGRTAGEVTSAALSPATGCAVALGYVREAYAQTGATLRCGDAAATVVAPRPS